MDRQIASVNLSGMQIRAFSAGRWLQKYRAFPAEKSFSYPFSPLTFQS
jgi:hypothetical protein